MVKGEMRNKIRIMASKVLVTAMLVTCLPTPVHAAETLGDELLVEEPATIAPDTLYEKTDELLEETGELTSSKDVQDVSEELTTDEMLDAVEGEKHEAESYFQEQNDTFPDGDGYAEVEYIDDRGELNSKYAQILDGSETQLNGGWYIAQGSVNYTHGITISGYTYIILADGSKVTLGTKDNPLSTNAIYGDLLCIYGQSAGTGSLSVNVCCEDSDCDAISVSNYIQYSGNVTVINRSADGSHFGNGIYARSGVVSVYGNSLSAISEGGSTAAIRAYSNVTFNGGIINAVNNDYHGIISECSPVCLYFSGTKHNCQITSSSYYCPNSSCPCISYSVALIEFENGAIKDVIAPGYYYEDQAYMLAGRTFCPAYKIQSDIEGVTIGGDVIEIAGVKFALGGSAVCLGYNGDIPEGYEVAEYYYSYYSSNNSSYEHSSALLTMPRSDVYIKGITYATTDVEYVDVDGVIRNVNDNPDIGKAIVLMGNETFLEEGWYVAFGNIQRDYSAISLLGKVNIILADDSSINIGSSSNRRNWYGSAFCSANSIDNAEYTAASLSIYGQEKKSGALNMYCSGVPVIETDGAIRINGVNVYCDSIDNNSSNTNAMGIKSGSDIVFSNAIVSINSTRTCMEAGGDIRLNNSEVTATTLGENNHNDYYTLCAEGSIYVNGSKLSQYNKESYYGKGRGGYIKGQGEIIDSELTGDDIIIDSDIIIENSRVECNINGTYYPTKTDKANGISGYSYDHPLTVNSKVEINDCNGFGSVYGVVVSANKCTGSLGFEAKNNVVLENCDLCFEEDNKQRDITAYQVYICDSEINGHYYFEGYDVSLSRNKIQLTSPDPREVIFQVIPIFNIYGTLIISDCNFSCEDGIMGDLYSESFKSDLFINNSKFSLVSHHGIWDSSRFMVDYFNKVYIDDGSEVTIFRSGNGYSGYIRALDLYVRNSKLSVGGSGRGILLTEYEGVNGCLHIDEGSEVALGNVCSVGDIIINGGKLSKNTVEYGYGSAYGSANLMGRKILLGWSGKDDFITAASYEEYPTYYGGSSDDEHNYDNVVHIMQGKRFLVNSVSQNQNFVYDPNYDDEYNYSKAFIEISEGIIGSLTEETVLNEEQNKALWGKILRPFGYSVTASEGVSHGVEPTVINGKEYYLYFDDEACVLRTAVPATGMKKITTTSGTVKQTGAPGEFMLSGINNDASVSVDTVTLTVDDIADQAYTGAAVKPALTVKDGETVLVEGVDYTVSYSDNILPGTATATVTGKGAYFGSITKAFNVVTAGVTVTAKAQRVQLGGSISTSADMVSATGLAEGHYIAAITITSVHGTAAVGEYEADLVPSSVTIKDVDGTDVTEYYSITYLPGALSVTKAFARIATEPAAKTGLKYKGTAQELVMAGSSDEGTVQYCTDYNTETESGTWNADIPAKTDAGDYKIYYKIIGDASHADSNVAGPISVSINKTPLTVTAKPKTITYGDVPANDGVEYSGFVNGETQAVLGGTLAYEYGYPQYGDVGSAYTITPGGYTSGNYDISYSSGTLTVSKKEIGLDWSDAALTYNGSAQAPAVTATGLVNGDEVTVTVTGTQTNAGDNYTATATGLQGAKAGNYKLPAANTKTFAIGKAAHDDVTAEGSAKYGLGSSVELASLMESGASTGDIAVTDNDGILEGMPAVSNNVLTFVFADNADNAGKSAAVSIPVVGALNYVDYAITVTLNVIDCSHEHTTIVNVKKATCTEKGYTGDTKCLDCGAIISSGEETPIDPDNHSYDNGVITTQPTILNEGIKTYTCTRCHHQYTESVPRLKDDSGEDYSGLIKDATDDKGKTKAEVENKSKEDGSEETTVKIGGEPVSVTTKEKDGTTTVQSVVWIGGLKSAYTYTGAAIKPEIHVYDGTKKLTADDYSVSYRSNKEAGGTATVTVNFKGNYKSTPQQKKTFEIMPASLSADLIVPAIAIAANGKVQKPVPTVTWKDTRKSVNKSNFTYVYKDLAGNEIQGVKAAGDYTVTVKAKNSNFTQSATVKVTVIEDKKALISKASITFTPNKYTYTGKAIVPARDSYTVKLANQILTEGKDYTVSFSNNIEPGKAAAVFTAVDGSGYYGSKSVTFTIAKGRKLELQGSGSPFTYEFAVNAPYEKGGAKPDVVVKDGGKVLTSGTDYTVAYSKNTKITNGEKTAVITIKGKGNYKGNVKLNFAVAKKNISLLTASAADKVESSKGYKKPTITIVDTNDKKLRAGSDFEIDPDSYPASAVAGDTITIKLNGKGAYEGQTQVSYRYIKASQNLAKVKALKIKEAKTYTGSEIKLTTADLTGILYTGTASEPNYLIPGKDFEVAGYTNNIKKGTAQVTLKGIGEYGGTKTLQFSIKQKTGDCKGALIDGEWK